MSYFVLTVSVDGTTGAEDALVEKMPTMESALSKYHSRLADCYGSTMLKTRYCEILDASGCVNHAEFAQGQYVEPEPTDGD